MKSKRAAAAVAVEDVKPVDVAAEDQSIKKRKRTDEDGELDTGAKKSKKDKKNKLDKSDKKSKKDKSKYSKESRKEKKDKLKDLQDLPDVDDDEAAEPKATSEQPAVAEVDSSKTNGSKTNGSSAEGQADKKQKKKEKNALSKEKKKEKKALDKEQKQEKQQEKNASAPREDAIDLDASAAHKPGRNIVFVGNLPYSATAASITAHFASLKPVAVRCLTKKDDPKACRGIAFVEFGTPAHQRTCLDKFHHSMFEDGISAPRKINVELT